MAINYQLQTDPKTTARAGVTNARLSWKDSIEMSRFLKGMKSTKAKAFLEDVILKKRALPLPRFNDNRAHKPGKVGPGRYPVNASKTFLELIKSAEKNALFKGLDEKNLIVKYVFANKGATFIRPRKNELRGQIRKSANISIILEGKESAVKHSKSAAKPASTEAKKEQKPAEKKAEEKHTEHSAKAAAKTEHPTAAEANSGKKSEKQEKE